mmetsp:Transcript_17334/g.41407  ORF Transcript_17334/g.41407 Transcript_17334/m.41407 type:complete len:626 (+) Transcript_17334:138-2015(+)
MCHRTPILPSILPSFLSFLSINSCAQANLIPDRPASAHLPSVSSLLFCVSERLDHYPHPYPCQMKLPSLMGMLFAGVLLRNIPGDPVRGLPEEWSSAIRVAGLSIIFIRSGLELDWRSFRRVGLVALRLTLCPGVTEAVVVGLVSLGLFGMPIFMGLTLGFILAAVSPAVVVNGMFALQKAGLGTDKGIPSLVVAAASLDDVVAITGYSLFIGLAVPSGGLGWNIAQGPLNLVFGVVGGACGGLLLSATALWRKRWQRSFAIFVAGQLLMAFFVRFHFKGAGAMASLVMGLVAMIAWEAGWPRPLSVGPSTHFAHEAEADMAVIWQLFGQPMLFSVIGTALDFRLLAPTTVPLAIAAVAIGVAVRLPIAGSVVWGANLNVKERLFVALAWLPKATVQAALASSPLDAVYSTMMSNPEWMTECRNEGSRFRGDPGFEEFCRYDDWGQDILTTAVFSIILTAPIGLLIISTLGPRWLTQDKRKQEEEASKREATEEQSRAEEEAEGHAAGDSGAWAQMKRMESNLLSVEMKLRVLEDASQLLKGDPESVFEFKDRFQDAVTALRRQIARMEFESTPATFETAGQFFRVQDMEDYWAETNHPLSAARSRIARHSAPLQRDAPVNGSRV